MHWNTVQIHSITYTNNAWKIQLEDYSRLYLLNSLWYICIYTLYLCIQCFYCVQLLVLISCDDSVNHDRMIEWGEEGNHRSSENWKYTSVWLRKILDISFWENKKKSLGDLWLCHTIIFIVAMSEPLLEKISLTNVL